MGAPTVIRVLLAGLAGGAALSAAMALTFGLVGFGWNGGGPLLDPALQSPKLIAVWTTLEPLPLVVDRPGRIVPLLFALGVGHAAVYRRLAPAWPAGVPARAVRFGGLVFLLSYVFWEIFTPYNQFGEPLPLILLELAFWAVIAVAEAFAIAWSMEYRRDPPPRRGRVNRDRSAG